MTTPFGVLAPRLARHAPHDLELVAVGVGAVERLAHAVVGGAPEGPGRGQDSAAARQVLDGRDLPGEVVQPDRAARRARRVRSDGEQAEVVVVVPAAGRMNTARPPKALSTTSKPKTRP